MTMIHNDIPYDLIARYLAGECSGAEKEAVEQWSRQHPDTMKEMTEIWELARIEAFNPDVTQALERVSSRIDTHKGKTRKLFIPLLAAAAVVLFVMIAGIHFWLQPEPAVIASQLQVIQTGNGDTTEFVLADGSRVWLNHHSTLHYPETFNGDTREVHMTGEVYFEITPNARKPFMIRAGNSVTEVVGTSFGIKAVQGTSEVFVTVTSGTVNLSTEGENEKIELNQGEQGRCIPDQQKLEKTSELDLNVLAWKTKVLVFRNAPLSYVAQILTSVYHTPVSVDAALADLQITSTFDNQTFEEVIKIIGMTLSLKTDAGDNSIHFTR